MNPRSMIAIAGVLIPLSGCGGIRPRPQPAEETRLKVPYIADRREQWGPAAVADVLSFLGRPVDLKALRRQVRFTRKPADVERDLEKAGAAQGFKAEMSQADLAAVKRELDAGRPVIVVVNTGFRWIPVRGYMVVTGYSERRRCIYAHWGPNKDFFVSYRQFRSDWKKSGNWLLRIEGTDAAARAGPRASSPDAALPGGAVEGPAMPELLWLTP